ncbi:MAG: lectin [Luteimonas sp.]
MLRHLSVLAFAVLAIAACNRQAPTTAPSDAAAPVAATPPATATAGPAAQTGPGFNGYGRARFGMTAQETRQAWPGPLVGAAPASGGDCYQLSPASAESPRGFSIMLEGDKFVRYDVGTDAETAPGGGKVGMTVDQIRSLYAGRIREQPAKYAPGGVDLRVGADDDSGSALVFETDAAGKVARWRVGQPPAVDYSEGCS